MGQDQEPVEQFDPSSGTAFGFVTLAALGVAVVLVAATERTATGLQAVLALVAFGALTWAALIRPRAAAYRETLVIRHMFSDVHLPLARIDEVVTRQVLYVYLDDERHSCAGIGRSSRRLAGLPGSLPTGHEAQLDYARHVETRILELAERARRESAGPPPPVRREWAVPEILGVTVPVALLVLTTVLG